jgi:hypothetical protein
MNDQFNYKEIAEEQCNRRYHTEMWKDERVQVLKERAELLAENERLRAALIFIRDKEQASLNEAERLRFNIPEEAGCMEILHAARAALEQKS